MKYLSILILASLFIFVGCSGDDPAAPPITGIDQSATVSGKQVVPGDQADDLGLMNGNNGMVPFRGTYTTTVAEAGFIPPTTALLDLWGVGNASHFGRSSWYSLSSVDIATGVQWGSTVEVTASGDEFHYDYLGGSFMDPETGLSSFWGDWTVTGGTGRFAGGTGGGTYSGTADTSIGTGQITLIGEISRPTGHRYMMD